MTHSGGPAGSQEWQDWSEIVAADMVDPTFRAAVDQIAVDQERWARESFGG